MSWNEIKLTDAYLIGLRHHYTFRDGKYYVSFNDDGDGVLNPIIDSPDNFLRMTQEEIYREWGESAQKLITQFRNELPTELARVKRRLDPAPQIDAFQNFDCSSEEGAKPGWYTWLGIQPGSCSCQDVRYIPFARYYLDGRTRSVSFGTADGVLVMIAPAPLEADDGTCLSYEGQRKGVEEYLRMFERYDLFPQSCSKDAVASR